MTIKEWLQQNNGKFRRIFNVENVDKISIDMDFEIREKTNGIDITLYDGVKTRSIPVEIQEMFSDIDAERNYKIIYREKTTLEHDDNPNGSHEEELPDGDTLLIGEDYIYHFCDSDTQYGYYRNYIYPAYYNGKKSFVQQKQWIAQGNYCGSGGEEFILDFETGAKLLIEKGAYSKMF